MWLLFKSFQYSDCYKNMISILESIISEYGNVEEIISQQSSHLLDYLYFTLNIHPYSLGLLLDLRIKKKKRIERT